MSSDDQPELEVRPLDKDHDRAAFSCGDQELDDYLRTMASQNVRRDMAIAWVMSEPAGSEIIGYYTLTNRDIVSGPIPEDVATKLKVSPKTTHVPGILLGRFAIATKFQKQGLGGDMCMDALHRSYIISQTSAAFGVIVHPSDDKAADFWTKMDFTYLKKDANGHDAFFMPMSHIKKIFK